MNNLWLALGLGLLGFIEPCTMGTNLLLVKHLEGQPVAVKRGQMLLYTLTRALFMGLLGLSAAWIGSRFFALQRGLWEGFGGVYLLMGLLYLSGRQGWLIRVLHPTRPDQSTSRRSALIGVLFALNIPACAAPLLLALLGVAATRGAGTTHSDQGFWSLMVFGLALSLPLLMALSWSPAARLLDRFIGLSARAPRWTGWVLLGLGFWSVSFGLLSHTPA